ncbi:MAG: carboxysome shell protein, partial [Prochlorococcaceae cyanobacterium]
MAAPARAWRGSLHPLSDGRTNALLESYEARVQTSFERIVPVLKEISALQHESDFVALAQRLAQASLGFALPVQILEKAWVSQLDMRTLFAWC